MTTNEIRETIKKMALEKISDALETAGAEKYSGDYKLAIPVTIEGAEYWCKIDLSAAQWTKTKTSNPFDPFALQAEYLEEKAIKDQKKAESKAKKDAKAAKDKAKREEAE